MLIWIRAHKDNLIYTMALVNTFIALAIIVYGNYKLGVLYGFANLLLFLIAIVWNE